MPIALLTIASFAFALGIVVAKPAMNRLGLRTFLMVRVATGLIGALTLWQAAGRPLTLGRENMVLVLTSLLVCPVLLNLLFFAGLACGGVGPVNSLRYTAPLWAALFAFLWWIDVPATPAYLSFALIVAGVWVLWARGHSMSVSRLALVLALASGAGQGGSVLLQQGALEVLSREELLLYQNIAFALVLAAWTLLGKAKKPSPHLEGRERTVGILLAVLSGMMVCVLGELLKFYALPNFSGPMAVAILQLSLPCSALQAAWLLGE